MSLLTVRDLHASYGAIRAVKGVSLSVGPHQAVAVLGANGAGKSTLLFSITGVVRPAAGEVLIDGRDVTRTGPERKVGLGLALVPERRQLFGALSVRDNLTLGAYTRRSAKDVAEDLDRVHALFPILAERAKQPAGTLSGGEQQMAAIGRGLMARPRLLALDEPSLGLAPLVVQEIVGSLLELRKSGVALLLVEQNARAAMTVSDRVMVMERGAIVAEGAPEQLTADERVQKAYLGHP